MKISDQFRKRARPTLATARAIVAEVRETAMFLSAATRLRPRLGPMLMWNGIDDGSKRLGQEFMNSRNTNDGVAYGAFFVVCYGALEEYLRDILTFAVEAINAASGSFDGLPPKLAEENVYRTGIALQSIRRPLAHTSYDFQALAANLATCSGGDTFLLNASCFTTGHGVLNAENIAKLFGRISIEIQWDSFGRDQALRDILEETGTRECATATRAFLDQLASNRNRVAHTGGLASPPAIGELTNVIEFLDRFSSLLLEEVAQQLQKKFGNEESTI